MNPTVVQVVLVFLVFAAVDGSEEHSGDVTFWKENVTLKCPGEGDWFKNGLNQTFNGREFNFKYLRQGQYMCKYPTKYEFFVKGRVCDSCFELEGHYFLLIITMDLLLTSTLMMVIYRWINKKTPHEAPRSTKAHPPATSASKSHGQGARIQAPVNSSPYEPLNPNTRSSEIYSTAGRG